MIKRMSVGKGGYCARDGVQAGKRNLDADTAGGFSRPHLNSLGVLSAEDVAQAHAGRGAFFIGRYERAHRVLARRQIGQAEAAVAVALSVDGPGIHQRQTDIGPFAFFCLSEELKVHADGRCAVVEGHRAGDLSGALDLNGYLGDAVCAYCDLSKVILPLLDGIVALFPACGERFELVRVQSKLRVQVTIQRGESVVMAGLDGLQPEASIQIGDGGFRGRERIGIVALLAFLRYGREDDGGKAGRLAGVRAENDARNHALGGVGLFMLELVASGQKKAGDGQNRQPTQPRQGQASMVIQSSGNCNAD